MTRCDCQFSGDINPTVSKTFNCLHLHSSQPLWSHYSILQKEIDRYFLSVAIPCSRAELLLKPQHGLAVASSRPFTCALCHSYICTASPIKPPQSFAYCSPVPLAEIRLAILFEITATQRWTQWSWASQKQRCQYISE